MLVCMECSSSPRSVFMVETYPTRTDLPRAGRQSRREEGASALTLPIWEFPHLPTPTYPTLPFLEHNARKMETHQDQ